MLFSFQAFLAIMNPKKQWLEDYSSQAEVGDKGGGGAAKETTANQQPQAATARPPFARQGSLCSGMEI